MGPLAPQPHSCTVVMFHGCRAGPDKFSTGYPPSARRFAFVPKVCDADQSHPVPDNSPEAIVLIFVLLAVVSEKMKALNGLLTLEV